jgi:hypothetical protein
LTPVRIGSLEKAAAWIDEVGVALVFGKADIVLPSLWDAIADPADRQWAIRDEQGAFVSFTPEFGRLWRWKDELPERRRVCAGRHVARGAAALIARRLLPSLYALTGRAGTPEDFRNVELSPLEREVGEAVLEEGPASAPELRRFLGAADKKSVDKAIELLHRAAVLTNAGVVEQEQGWAAARHDLFSRRWRRWLRRLPPADEARRTLAQAVLESAGEVSAADVAAALAWRRKEAAVVLEELAGEGIADAREDDGIRLWVPLANARRRAPDAAPRSCRAGSTRRSASR